MFYFITYIAPQTEHCWFCLHNAHATYQILRSIKQCCDFMRNDCSDLSCFRAHLFIHAFDYDLRIPRLDVTPKSGVVKEVWPAAFSPDWPLPGVPSPRELQEACTAGNRSPSSVQYLCQVPWPAQHLAGWISWAAVQSLTFQPPSNPVSILALSLIAFRCFCFFYLCLELCVSFYILVVECWESWVPWLQRNSIDLIA